MHHANEYSHNCCCCCCAISRDFEERFRVRFGWSANKLINLFICLYEMKFEREKREKRRIWSNDHDSPNSSVVVIIFIVVVNKERTGGRTEVRSNLMKLINYCWCCCCCFCFALFVLQQDQFTFFSRSVLPFNLYFIALIEL